MIVRARFFLPAALAAAAFLQASAASAAPQCVVMKFTDSKGVAISTEQPVIAIMIGGKPAMEADVPAGATLQPGAETECPASLLDIVRDTFQDSCVSEARRKQAALEHNVDRKIVDKGCADMIAAIGAPALAAPKTTP